LSRFRFRHAMEVRFRDLDALGHVNNAVYLTYFESARMAFWMQVLGKADLTGMNMILARAEIDFRSPLVFGESVEIGVGCTSIGRSSFVLEQDMHERASSRLVAQASKVLVHYDYAALRSLPLTDEMRRMLQGAGPQGPGALPNG